MGPTVAARLGVERRRAWTPTRGGAGGPRARGDAGARLRDRAAGGDGAIVREPDAAPPGTALRVRVARGEITARVEGEG